MSRIENREMNLSMLELNMLVRYINDAKFHYLTLNKEYSVYEVHRGVGDPYIRIKDDKGKLSYYSLHWFEEVL